MTRAGRIPVDCFVQPALALQTALNGASDAGGNLDQNVLVIMDHDVELLAGDGTLLDTDPEGLLQQRCHGASEQALVADSRARAESVDRPLHLVEPSCNLGTKLLDALVHLLEALVYLLEAALHLGTQRSQLGEHQGDFFAPREGLQECMKERRLQVRPTFQHRRAPAEQIDQVFVTE